MKREDAKTKQLTSSPTELLGMHARLWIVRLKSPGLVDHMFQ